MITFHCSYQPLTIWRHITDLMKRSKAAYKFINKRHVIINDAQSQ
ncbi:hypothetical protein AO385_1739 [Moraxella catarrhalis]|nr:hypothetical protein AO385_1739 [Moraxella catarrhalis]